MSKKNFLKLVEPPRKSWLTYGKRVALVVGKVAAIVLASPFKLPSKLLLVSKYVMIAVGIISSTEKKEDE